MNTHPHFREPIWRAPRLPASRRPPAGAMDWLLDSSSLTQRLMARCEGDFRVEVICQRRQRPRPSEARLLGMRAGARALVREVFLCCGEARWVYARTVIPDRTASGRYRRLARLGSRPLGAFLFAQPRLARGPLEVAEATIAGASAWGRRSVFFLSGRPLIVSEYFLPDFLECCGANAVASGPGL